ncbi:MAG TPA: DUF2917 domain-containing protein [Abditibacteriaceae bacterium]|jgi:hypothetical protein
MSQCTCLSASAKAAQKKKSPFAAVRAWLSHPFARPLDCTQQRANAMREMRLGVGETQSYCAATRARFFCRSGSVWLTQSGDARDIILHAGDEFESNARTRIVVTSLHTSARLTIEAQG